MEQFAPARCCVGAVRPLCLVRPLPDRQSGSDVAFSLARVKILKESARVTFQYTSHSNPSSWPSWPIYRAEERAAVQRVIDSNQLFAAQEVRTFENVFRTFVGTEHAIGVGNATQGLHLALAALDIGLGDEVIVTPYSWISSASCVLMQNATPVFCDIEPETFGLDPDVVDQRITPRTKAIIAVHPFEYPIRIDELVEVAVRHGLALIEDGSHALGAMLGSRGVGTFGSLSVFSLHQRKSLSIGDGGMVCTNDPQLAEKVSRLRSFGDDDLSYNYRMTEFAAAIGNVRIERLDEENALREQNSEYLASQFGSSSPIEVVWPRTGTQGVFYAALLLVTRPIVGLEKSLELMRDQGVPIRFTWSGLNKHPHFNPRRRPARGFPEFNGIGIQKAGRHSYKSLSLPVADSLLPYRILEFYVHPPANREHIDFAISLMEQYQIL